MKRFFSAAAVLLVAIAVAGCGGGGGGDHNAQDVSFAKDMVPHHQQAVTMADMALAQASTPQVKDLATRIKEAQGPELATMNGWLVSWGESATDHSGHSVGSGHDMKSMKGMVSGPEMAAMGATSGAEFDRLFVKHMTAHHQAAVDMAKVELEKGKYEPAKALARGIITAQEKEIAEMATLQIA